MLELPHPLWSTTGREARLLASRHRHNAELVFPALPEASPLAPDYETVPIDAVGEVYSFTVIHPSAKSGLAPYALGYVDLPGPVRIFGRLRGKDRPAIGEHYEARPDDEFGYVFVAVEA